MSVVTEAKETLGYRDPASFQETGIRCIAGYPSEWDVQRTKNLFRLVCEPAPANNDFELLSVYTDIGVRPRKDLEERGNRATTTDGYWKVKKGDLIVNKILAWMGAMGMSNYEGVTSPAYDILRSRKDLNVKYYDYLFRCGIMFPEFRARSKGIMDMRLRLYFDQFGQIPVPVPPRSEQDAIVAFLDRKLEEIDRFIANKRRLIELLEESRVKRVNELICGQMQNELIESGNLFLGQIPSRWELKPLSSYAKYVSYGFTNPMPTEEDGPLMLTANDIGDGYVKSDSARRTSQRAFDTLLTPKSRPRPGDLLITKDGTLGRTALMPEIIACINQSVALIRLTGSVELRAFIFEALRAHAYQMQMALDAGGTTIKHIYITRLVKMLIAIPPEDELRPIVDEVQLVNSQSSETRDRMMQEITLMNEFRTSLIAEAVTGKTQVTP